MRHHLAAQAPADDPAKPLPADTVARLRETLPRPLVFTHGVFDLLHAGHVACLEAARRQGASLVVGLRGDGSARRRYKGDGRPLNLAADRARVLAALSAVSAVVLFEEDKPLALICALRPDVLVTGSHPHEVVQWPEAALIAEWGGQAFLVQRVPDHSTSGLIARARTRLLLPPGEPRGAVGPTPHLAHRGTSADGPHLTPRLMV